MINWDEFEHIHVIRKLKEILGTWWNIDTLFTDDRGHLKGFEGEKRKMLNPAVRFLLEKQVNLEGLQDLVAKAVNDLRQSGNGYAIRNWDAAGFDVGVFPIMIENDMVGAVVALGFFKDASNQNRLNEVRDRLAAFHAAPRRRGDPGRDAGPFRGEAARHHGIRV